ncbi:MAG: permease [Deltaproteobacteria bacterium]|nr:permease [Deltaproteobacteria bacterium]
MITALLMAGLPVLLGGAVGFAPGLRPGALRPLWAFAFAAAMGIALGELLPDAAASLGGGALLLFAAGFFVPGLLERLLLRRGGLGPDFAFVAIAAHQLVDGVAIGSATHLDHGREALMLAFSAHAAPMVAVAALGVARLRGQGALLRWIAGLLLVTCLGVVLSSRPAFGELLGQAEAVSKATLAGVLLHVLAHGAEAPGPRGLRARLIDLGATAAGATVPLLLLHFGAAGHPAHAAGHPASPAGLAFGDALLELILESAPSLLLGLGLGALLQAVELKVPPSWFAGGRLAQALRGALVGAPLPICACGILPVSEGLWRRGAGPALVVAFLLCTPELGIETFALSVHFLGWPFALLRLVGAISLSVLAALTMAWAVSGAAAAGAPGGPLSGGGGGPLWRRVLFAFDELVLHVSPWVAAGLLLAAYVEAYLPAEQIALVGGTGLDVLLMAVVAVPTYVCASSATPLAAVLWAKGLSPGAALVGLLLGPATNVATIGFLRGAYGKRATGWTLAVMVLFAFFLAGVANLTLPAVPTLRVEEADAHAHGGWLEPLTALALAAMVLRSLWMAGVEGWVAQLGMGHSHDHSHDHDHGGAHEDGPSPAHAGDHDHGHDHDHAHGHDHAHEHAHDAACADDHAQAHPHPHDHGACAADHDHDHGAPGPTLELGALGVVELRGPARGGGLRPLSKPPAG